MKQPPEVFKGHQTILRKAAEIANKESQTVYGADFFKEAEPASRKGGLCLEISPANAKQTKQLKEIGKRAIQKALVEEKELFVGLIVGEARIGRNYFDHFK